MSHPTLRILAFSPPAVNGQLCSVLVNGGGGTHPVLEGSAALMRSFAEAILASTGGAAGLPGPLRRSKHHAQFTAIAAELAKGNWDGNARTACKEHGVAYSTFIYWRGRRNGGHS